MRLSSLASLPVTYASSPVVSMRKMNNDKEDLWRSLFNFASTGNIRSLNNLFFDKIAGLSINDEMIVNMTDMKVTVL